MKENDREHEKMEKRVRMRKKMEHERKIQEE
jgi:hypothetical protein